MGALMLLGMMAAGAGMFWELLEESKDMSRRKLLFNLFVIAAVCSIWAFFFLALAGPTPL